MKKKIKEKYLLNKEELYVVGKKILKLIVIILLIRSTRIILVKSHHMNNLINKLLSFTTPEKIFQFYLINMMTIGVMGLMIGYLIKGKVMMKTKWFGFLLFVCIIDALLKFLHQL